MNAKLIQLLILILALDAFIGCSNHTKNQLHDSSELTITNYSISNNSDEPSSDQPETIADWSNPFINPLGQNIVSYLRAFYLTGQVDLLSHFLIGHEELNTKDYNALIRGSKWGYKLKATNVKWSNDSTFIITCKTMKNNTEGMEEYFGVIKNDTAKLFFYPQNQENPFVYNKR